MCVGAVLIGFRALLSIYPDLLLGSRFGAFLGVCPFLSIFHSQNAIWSCLGVLNPLIWLVEIWMGDLHPRNQVVQKNDDLG